MIFVFGSNKEGRHGKGAALTAKLHHGAIQNQGEGLMGNSYALPTQHTPYVLMQLFEIRGSVRRFIEFAKAHPELAFQVTQAGCGLAGHMPYDVAPMFKDAPDNCLFDSEWQHLLPTTKRFWGTFP